MAATWLGAFIELVRDLSVTAAAVGVAAWGWERFQAGPMRLAGEAQRRRSRERAARQADERDLRDKEAEVRQWLKALVQQILQESEEDVTSFPDLLQALSREAGKHKVLLGEGEIDALQLRRILIELIGAGVVGQTADDEYHVLEHDDWEEPGG